MDNINSAKIRNLIADNKTQTAIELLLSLVDEQQNREEYDQLILLNGQLQRAKMQENLGIISFSDGLRNQTQISYAILNLLDKLDRAKTHSPNPNPKSEKEVILFLAADSDGRLELEKEFVQIGVGLQQDLMDYYNLVSAWTVTPDSFQTEILKRKPTILHFSGHGKANGIYLQDSKGEDKFVNGTALTNFFKVFTKRFPIKCVFLNSCYSEEQAETIGKYVKYVIGMNKAVDNMSAIKFSTAFYRTYAREQDMEFAFDLAVNAIQLDASLEDSDAPVIYIDGAKRAE